MKTCQATIGGCYRPDRDAQPIAKVVLVLPPLQDVTFPPVTLRTCEQHEGETGHYMASALAFFPGILSYAAICDGNRSHSGASELRGIIYLTHKLGYNARVT